MLKEATINKIAALLKLDVAKVKEAISHKDEKDLEIDEKLQVFNEADLTSRDRNKYQEGKTAGEEMLVKSIKEKNAIDVTGTDVEKVIEALVGKVKKEAGGKPDEKAAELEKQVNHWKEKHTEANNKLTDMQRQISEANYDRELLSYFPANKDSKFQNDEYLTLIKRSIKVEDKDGKKIVTKDGKEMRNESTFEPTSLKDVIDGYFTERKWISEEGAGGSGEGQRAGGGGGNSKPGGGTGKFNKMSDVNKYLTDNKIDAKSEKGQAFVMGALKDNPEMDLNQ